MKKRMRHLKGSKQLNTFLNNLYIDNSIPIKYNNRFKNLSIPKMNRLMVKFFKQPDMVIKTDNNIIPFRFYTSDRVTLNGIQYITNKKTNKWIISTHDFGQNKYWALFFAKPLIELGYNILSFDFRNHGDNQEKEPITLGQLETTDLKSAINWLVENRHPEYLGLMGTGLGAYAINNLYLEDNFFFKDQKIKFAICESNYNAVENLIINQRHHWSRTYRSRFVKKTSKKVNKIIEAAKKEEHVDLRTNNLLRKLEENKKELSKHYVPFFYTNSSINTLVPAQDAYEMIIARTIFSSEINLDEIIIYNFSESRLIFKDHFKKNLYEIIKFENKVIKDDELTKEVLNRLELTLQTIEESRQERYEVTTFSHQ